VKIKWVKVLLNKEADRTSLHWHLEM